MPPVSRRQVLRTSGLAAFAALLPPELLEASGAFSQRRAGEQAGAEGGAAGGAEGRAAGAVTPGKRALLVLSDHEARVVEEATARLIPGPLDDPAEKGHPGAREADVTRFIDRMLGALSLRPAEIFAGGPFSNRAGNATDDMAHFIGLSPAESYSWSRRLASWKDSYRKGVRHLDAAAGGNFLTASLGRRDAALGRDPGGFTTLLFSHAIDAMYSNPEYGGNARLVGWHEIKFPGDVQPRGYTAKEVSRSDGPDRYNLQPIAAELLGLIAISNER